MARAASRVGERRYSLVGNNREHFVNWCATGVAVSQQVVAFLGALVRMMTAVAWSVLAAFVARASFAE